MAHEARFEDRRRDGLAAAGRIFGWALVVSLLLAIAGPAKAGEWQVQAASGHLWTSTGTGGTGVFRLFDAGVCAPDSGSGTATWVVPIQLSETGVTYSGVQYHEATGDMRFLPSTRLVSFTP